MNSAHRGPLALFAFPFALVGLSAWLTGCAADATEAVGATEDALCSTECRSGELRGDALLTPVNRTAALRSDWAPVTSTLPEGYRNAAGHSLRADARAAFIAMVDAARTADVNLVCLSGYRSFATQCSLFASYASQNGCEQANTFSANAGHSEHQLGTVCDIALASSSSSFITPGGAADQWLRAHAHEHGFACSYPNADASQNDGYVHEPWHYRYIGPRAAAELKAREATLGAGRRLSVPVFIGGLSAAERTALDVGADTGGSNGGSNGSSGSGTGSSGTGSSGGGSSTPTPTGDCATIPFGGLCTGAVLEWCQGGEYHRVDCAAKTDGRTTCGEDPRDTVGKNCLVP